MGREVTPKWFDHRNVVSQSIQTTLGNGSKIKPLSTCRPDYRRNEISVERDDKCCWKCKACNQHDIIENNTCQTCAEGFASHKNLSRCVKLPLKFVNMDTPLSIVFISLSSLGILAVLIVLAVFITKRRHRLIKASGREMCYIMFLGIIAIFLVPFTFLIRPTQNLCYLQRFSLHGDLVYYLLRSTSDESREDLSNFHRKYESI